MTIFMDPGSAIGPSRGRPIAAQDFMAVILVGYGENLYPLNQGRDVKSKALLPIANSPIIDRVLDWVLAAGIMDILILVPSADYNSMSEHLEHGYSTANYPFARLELKKFTEGEKEDVGQSMGIAREGTARLLKRFRQFIKNDFVVLPCDISVPSNIKLSSILDKHRTNPNAILTSVFYEPIETVRNSEDEKVLVGWDRETKELLLVQPVDANEEYLELRPELLQSHPRLSLSKKLLDAHVYVCRNSILQLLATRNPQDLDSLKEQVIPWLIKGGWQKGLAKNWAPILSKDPNPLASALARSTSSSLRTPVSPNDERDAARTRDASDPDAHDSDAPTHFAPIDCQVVIIQPAPPVITKQKNDKTVPPPPDHLVRANTIAGYWELNRKALRGGPFPKPQSDIISPSAQISIDSIVGDSTKLGDRTSVKKTIIGRHCTIGKNVKLSNCILWDYVHVDDGAQIDNSILCSHVRVGEKAQIKDSEFGGGYQLTAGTIAKNETKGIED